MARVRYLASVDPMDRSLLTKFLFQYPWVVAITQGDDIHCTGSIISSRFIISAAHCTRGVDTSKLEIVLGASNLKDPNNSEKGVIKRQIKSFESHNKNENGVDYDIAIIEVDEEILFVVSTFLSKLPYSLRVLMRVTN